MEDLSIEPKCLEASVNLQIRLEVKEIMIESRNPSVVSQA